MRAPERDESLREGGPIASAVHVQARDDPVFAVEAVEDASSSLELGQRIAQRVGVAAMPSRATSGGLRGPDRPHQRPTGRRPRACLGSSPPS